MKGADVAEKRVSMNYVDGGGNERKLYESGASKLKYVADRSGTTRFQLPAGEMAWAAKDVRAFQVQGLWEVTWLEEGDTEHKGAWRIDCLTDKGREVLERWERLVDNEGAARGPRRRNLPSSA